MAHGFDICLVVILVKQCISSALWTVPEKFRWWFLTSRPCPWAILALQDHSNNHTSYTPRLIFQCYTWWLLPVPAVLFSCEQILEVWHRPCLLAKKQKIKQSNSLESFGLNIYSCCHYIYKVLYPGSCPCQEVMCHSRGSQFGEFCPRPMVSNS